MTGLGCGQKGQGAQEHLWSFMDLIEEGMGVYSTESTHDLEGETPGAYVLFADDSGQDLCSGVEGGPVPYPVLHGSARGNVDHHTGFGMVELLLQQHAHAPHGMGSEGPLSSLKRACDKCVCVLSPVLYCIFINCFLAMKPDDTPVPESLGMPKQQWMHCIA